MYFFYFKISEVCWFGADSFTQFGFFSNASNVRSSHQEVFLVIPAKLLAHFQPVFLFSDVFRKYKSGTLVESGLKMNSSCIPMNFVNCFQTTCFINYFQSAASVFCKHLADQNPWDTDLCLLMT